MSAAPKLWPTSERPIRALSTALSFLLAIACATDRDGAPVSVAKAVPLEGTEWRLTQLGAEPVLVTEPQRAPSLVFHAVDRRVAGFGGCNRLAGDYALEGERLHFGPLATTRMACADGMELEAAFGAALERVERWHVLGRRLELYDAKGALEARFEAP